jgi:hypothetical protein
MTPEWRVRVLALAIRRRDLAARAILEGGRTWSPEPTAPPMLAGWRRLDIRRAA